MCLLSHSLYAHPTPSAPSPDTLPIAKLHINKKSVEHACCLVVQGQDGWGHREQAEGRWKVLVGIRQCTNLPCTLLLKSFPSHPPRHTPFSLSREKCLCGKTSIERGERMWCYCSSCRTGQWRPSFESQCRLHIL